MCCGPKVSLLVTVLGLEDTVMGMGIDDHCARVSNSVDSCQSIRYHVLFPLVSRDLTLSLRRI